MSDMGSVPDTASTRLITKVVLTYRLESDPKDTERTMVLEHGGGGEAIDGIVWGEELMKKLAYLEGGECVEPKKELGRGDWKVYSPETSEDSLATSSETKALSDAEVAAGETRTASAGDGDCIWLHKFTCEWDKYCPPPVL